MYENFTKSVYQIFPKFYVMRGIQKDVKATVYLSFRTTLIICREPLFGCFWVQSLLVSCFWLHCFVFLLMLLLEAGIHCTFINVFKFVELFLKATFLIIKIVKQNFMERLSAINFLL